MDTSTFDTAEIKRQLELGVPRYMHEGVMRYVEHGIIPGTFLAAVLANDLVGALGHADETNRACMHGYACMLHNGFPARVYGMWGSLQALEDWSAVGGAIGLARAPRTFSRSDLGEERAQRLAALVNRFGGKAEVVA